MRNLKKVLSLALALVMLLGMMMVGAGAADTGAADIADNHKEAATVLNAVKVVEGDNNGNMNGKGNLSRADATILIVRIKYGLDVEKLLRANPADTDFTDVSRNHYASGVIAHCVEQDIVHGITPTTFAPNGTITGIDFATLVMQALGIEGDYGSGAGRTSKVLVALRENGLDDQVVVTTAPITREAAFQLMFNALQYSPTGDAWMVNGVEFDNLKDATMYAAILGGDAAPVKAPATDSLAVTMFGLKADTDTDDFGRDVKVWKLGDETVYTSDTAAVAPAKTFTYQDIKDSDLKGLTFSNNAKDVTITDGKSAEGAIDADAVKDLGNDSAVVELYAGSDNKINKVIVINTYAAEVSAVTPANEKKETKRSITVGGMSYVTEDFEKGDVVLYTKGTDDKDKNYIVNVEAAEAVEGELTSYTSKAPIQYTIGGKTYALSSAVVSSFDDDALKAVGEGTYYLNKAGNIVYAAGEGAVNTGNYAVIVSAHAELKKAEWPATNATVTLQVKALLSDGTLGIYTVDGVKFTAGDNDTDSTAILKIGEDELELLGTATAGSEVVKADADVLDLFGGIYDYSLSGEKIKLNSAVAETASDDVTVIAAATKENAAITKGSLTLTYGSSDTAIINNKTVFVLLSEDGKSGTMVTGGAAALEATVLKTADKAGDTPATTVKAVVDTKDSAVAKVVFAPDFKFVPAVSETGNYAYLTGDYSQSAKADDEGKYTFTYTGISSDGEEVTLTEKAEEASVTEAGIYGIKDDGSLGDKHAATKVAVTAYGDGILVIETGDPNAFTVPEDAKIVIAETDAELTVGAQVYVIPNASTATQADIIFVLNAEEEEEEPAAKTAAATIGNVVYGSGTAIQKGNGSDKADITATITVTLADAGITSENLASKVTAESANNKVTVDVADSLSGDSNNEVVITLTSTSDTAIDGGVEITVTVTAVTTATYENATATKTVQVGAVQS